MKFAHFSHIWCKPGMTPHQRYEELWGELALCDELGRDMHVGRDPGHRDPTLRIARCRATLWR